MEDGQDAPALPGFCSTEELWDAAALLLGDSHPYQFLRTLILPDTESNYRDFLKTHMAEYTKEPWDKELPKELFDAKSKYTAAGVFPLSMVAFRESVDDLSAGTAMRTQWRSHHTARIKDIVQSAMCDGSGLRTMVSRPTAIAFRSMKDRSPSELDFRYPHGIGSCRL